MLVVLVDTRQRRATATILASKRKRYQARQPAMLTYVTETTALVEALTQVLRQTQQDYREAGKLLNEAHALLRVARSLRLVERTRASRPPTAAAIRKLETRHAENGRLMA